MKRRVLNFITASSELSLYHLSYITWLMAYIQNFQIVWKYVFQVCSCYYIIWSKIVFKLNWKLEIFGYGIKLVVHILIGSNRFMVIEILNKCKFFRQYTSVSCERRKRKVYTSVFYFYMLLLICVGFKPFLCLL